MAELTPLEAPEPQTRPVPGADAVRAQFRRVLAHSLFRQSKRSSLLLSFIVENTLKGELDELRERVIGSEVFKRAPGYDTGSDPTVRVAATDVRKRLSLYYGEPGHEGEVRILVPAGGYVAEFKYPEAVPVVKPVPALPEAVSGPLPSQPSSEPVGDHLQATGPADQEPFPIQERVPIRAPLPLWKRPAALLCVLAILLLVAAWAVHRALSPASSLESFWQPLTGQESSLLISIGSGAEATTTAPSTATKAPGASTPAFVLPPERGSVPMTDVNAAFVLTEFLRAHVKNVTVRPAQGTSLSDLKAGPALLVGSFANQWTMRFGSALPYRFQRSAETGQQSIQDAAHLGSRGWVVDMSDAPNQRTADYALISRVLDQTTGQWWTGIGGVTGLGTFVAVQTVTDANAMAHLAAQLPKGWERKNLQVVLAFTVVQGSPGAPKLVASQVW